MSEPYQQPYDPDAYPPPPPHGAYPPQPGPYYPPQPYKGVQKKRGLSMAGHSGHAIVSVLTCGLWLPVWFCWWMFRLVVRRRRVTKYYPR